MHRSIMLSQNRNNLPFLGPQQRGQISCALTGEQGAGSARTRDLQHSVRVWLPHGVDARLVGTPKEQRWLDRE